MTNEPINLDDNPITQRLPITRKNIHSNTPNLGKVKGSTYKNNSSENSEGNG